MKNEPILTWKTEEKKGSDDIRDDCMGILDTFHMRDCRHNLDGSKVKQNKVNCWQSMGHVPQRLIRYDINRFTLRGSFYHAYVRLAACPPPTGR